MFKKNKFKLNYQNLFHFFLSLFVLLIPWQTRWLFYDWPLGIELWEYGRLSLYASVIVLLLATIFFALYKKKELHFSHSNFFYILFIYSVVISFRSPAPLVSFYYLFLIYSAVIFAYLVRFIPKIFVYRAFLFSGTLQGILAIYQLFTQKVVASKWLGISEHLPSTLGTSVVEFADNRILRAYGSLPHPNVLGGFLFVVIFFGIYLWIEAYKNNESNFWNKFFKKINFWNLIFIIIALVISTYGILASFSRSAILALLLSLFSLTVINVFKRNWLSVNIIVKYLFIFFLVFWSFNTWFPGAWSTRIEMNGRLEQKSVIERVDTFAQLGWDNYKNVFFGQGLGMNTLATLEKYPHQEVYNVQPIHDIFILMFAELGLIGAFFIVYTVRRIIKSANKIDIMSTSLIMGLIIIGFFDHYLWTSWTGWILMSLGLVNMYKHHQE
ncbi:MAG: O-antigen ligase family protein [Patescibacteria group bacterium]|jgi:hypothetical protein